MLSTSLLCPLCFYQIDKSLSGFYLSGQVSVLSSSVRGIPVLTALPSLARHLVMAIESGIPGTDRATKWGGVALSDFYQVKSRGKRIPLPLPHFVARSVWEIPLSMAITRWCAREGRADLMSNVKDWTFSGEGTGPTDRQGQWRHFASASYFCAIWSDQGHYHVFELKSPHKLSDLLLLIVCTEWALKSRVCCWCIRWYLIGKRTFAFVNEVSLKCGWYLVLLCLARWGRTQQNNNRSPNCMAVPFWVLAR